MFSLKRLRLHLVRWGASALDRRDAFARAPSCFRPALRCAIRAGVAPKNSSCGDLASSRTGSRAAACQSERRARISGIDPKSLLFMTCDIGRVATLSLFRNLRRASHGMVGNPRMRALLVATAIAAALVLASVQARLEPLASAQDSEIDPRPSADAICAALDRSAAQHDLPLDFFTRLIWQESRFDPRSISHAGAQGIAQFMPETARRVGLFNPFDPIEALPKSAQLLRDLLTQFGNLGLAAAAYNAGPKRIEDWLALRKPLPQETQAYVRIITGRSAQEWAATGAGIWNAVRLPGPCARLASLVPHRTLTPSAPRRPQQTPQVAAATHQAERAARAIVAAHKAMGPDRKSKRLNS